MPGQDFLDLVQKYAAGRTPPLVDEQDPEAGLINGELLTIYQKGFAGRHLIPLGILVARPEHHDEVSKWEDADYHYNEAARDNWTQVCGAIRKLKAGEQACERCDREHAKQAASRREVIGYLCCHGMVDFAMPIFVAEEIVAMIFTGQRAPKRGTYWDAGFVEPKGIFCPLEQDAPEVEAWCTTVERLREAEKTYGFADKELVRRLEADVAEYHSIEVSPADVARIQDTLRQAAEHLSNLAESTYLLEKSKAVAGIRALVAKSIAGLQVNIEDVSGTLKSMADGMGVAADVVRQYFAIDYFAILTLDADSRRFRWVIESADTKPGTVRTGIWSDELRESQFSTLQEAVASVPEYGDFNAFPFRSVPFFDSVPTSGRGQTACRYVAARFDRLRMFPCVLLAGRKHGLSLEDLRELDRKDLHQVVDDFATVVNIFQFIEALHAASESLARFLEELAHDIRNPMQAIYWIADRLKRDAPEHIRPQIARLAAQIRRIHRLSQSVWLLEQLRHGRPELDTKGRVNVHQVIMDAVAMVRDSAGDKDIKIVLSPVFASWRPIHVDQTFFFQTMLNLLDNAVKYSYGSTEVRVDGEMSHPLCRISIVNRGIPIADDEREKIFRPGFRTPRAICFVQQGTGLGLCMVKAFAEYYGSIEVNCHPVPGTCHSVTEFRLTINQVD